MRRLLSKLLLPLIFAVAALAQDPYYTIFPADPKDDDLNKEITQDLEAKSAKDKVFQSKSKHLGTMYWSAPLNNVDTEYFRHRKWVRYVAVPEIERTSTYFRALDNPTRLIKRAIVSQVPAPSHLRLITQAKGQKIEDVDGYHFEENPGEGRRIFIIDTGLNAKHPDFAFTDVDWKFAGAFSDKNKEDPKGHGTCMASVAVGGISGVAKKAKLTMVKAWPSGPERWIDALVQVHDQIKDDHLSGKAVVSMSWGYDLPRDDEYGGILFDIFALLLNIIIEDLDVLAVAAAGQPAFWFPYPSTVPAILLDPKQSVYPGRKTPAVPNLVVVTGAELDGTHDQSTRTADWVPVAGLSDAVICANHNNDDFHEEYGTSPATAATAGLLAYFESWKSTKGAAARKRVLDTAYARVEKGPKIIWNGIDYRS